MAAESGFSGEENETIAFQSSSNHSSSERDAIGNVGPLCRYGGRSLPEWATFVKSFFSVVCRRFREASVTCYWMILPTNVNLCRASKRDRSTEATQEHQSDWRDK
jgi:hypothetical protein